MDADGELGRRSRTKNGVGWGRVLGFVYRLTHCDQFLHNICLRSPRPAVVCRYGSSGAGHYLPKSATSERRKEGKKKEGRKEGRKELVGRKCRVKKKRWQQRKKKDDINRKKR